MKTSLRFLALTFALALAHASAGEKFAIDPVHSTIGFKVKHLFSYVTGRFNEVEGVSAVGDEVEIELLIEATVAKG